MIGFEAHSPVAVRAEPRKFLIGNVRGLLSYSIDMLKIVSVNRVMFKHAYRDYDYREFILFGAVYSSALAPRCHRAADF